MSSRSRLCRRHYREAVAACTGCGGGMCATCAQAAGGDLTCDECLGRAHDERRRAELRRADARMLRHAGFAVPGETGDRVVIGSGTVRGVVAVLGCPVLGMAAAAVAAALRVRAGIDPVLAAVFLALPVSQGVRLLFGGVSRAAGLVAAALTLLAVVVGRGLVGNGPFRVDATSPALWREGAPLTLAGVWGPVVALLAAATIAYIHGVGHRVGRGAATTSRGRAGGA